MAAGRFEHTALKAFIEAIFVAAGLRPGEAAVEAEVLVWAELRGLASHGVFRVPMYLAWIAQGLRNPASKPETVRQKGATCLIDADRAPGLFMMTQAMERAAALAREHGVGWVVVRNTTHTGAMGYYVRQAAEAGMIGLATCASRPLMAYHGSRVPALGTSPLAIGVPRANGAPVVLDMASSAIPWGKLAQARANNETLAPGLALDANGRATTDPHAAQIPLPLAGPKGSGLAMMIECMTSLAGGLPLVAAALSGDSPTYNVQNAAAIAVDPAAFITADGFADEVEELATALAALPRAEGVDEILMPGERGDRQAAEQMKDGVPIASELWEQLAGIAEDLGVTPPASIS
ncbi:MAG TPA: Ldh family oxidoreductase [Alphaproteobacteria bacterium]|nr:Ldh family oxidoreductase [Alphaproteobacteria bacterium]